MVEQQIEENISEHEIENVSITSLLDSHNDKLDYDEEDSDNDDEEVDDARKAIKQDKLRQMEADKEMEKLKRLANKSSLNIFDVDSDYEVSCDELESPDEYSDEDDCGYLVTPPSRDKTKRNHMLYKVGTTPSDTNFFVGQEFENAVQFRKAITDYCVHQGRNVKYYKNHRDKVGARCTADGCTWKVWASWGGTKRTFIVKKLIGQHNCGRGKIVKKINVVWIADHYQSKFKVNPYLKLQEIVDTIWLEKGIEVSIFTAHKARKIAKKLILYTEQFGLLNRYAMEVLKSNSENIVKFHLESNIFKKLYICLFALRKGFLSGCRPFISIDGCFLKGPFRGQLLVAVGRDGNNQMFPIAWSVVEAENYDSWKWFLALLADDLETTCGSGFNIMSDQQKGLIKAVTEVWAQAKHRCCARHVYCNFRGVFGGGQEYRRTFWKLAKSTTENDFVERIKDFSKISNEVAKDILNRNYKKWCRAFFTSQSQCDQVDNNMSEVFNAYILNSRHKRIITMLEDIRESLMERMHKKRDFIAMKNVPICPRIQERLERSKYDARGWCAFWDGNFCFGVREGATQTKYVVNLSKRTCSCNSWQISGVPCNHGVAAIWKKGHRSEDYVADCYSRTTYLKAYDHCLEPLNGPREWPQALNDPILPPQLKKLKACRPTTKRRKQAGEVVNNRLSKAGRAIRCSRCGNEGHNKRGCPVVSESYLAHVSNVASTIGVIEHVPSSTVESLVSTQQSQTPMHNKGIGLYTYPNGYQRIGLMMPTLQQRVGVCTDYEGEQSLQSISTLQQNSRPLPSNTTATTSNANPWSINANGEHRITRET